MPINMLSAYFFIYYMYLPQRLYIRMFVCGCFFQDFSRSIKIIVFANRSWLTGKCLLYASLICSSSILSHYSKLHSVVRRRTTVLQTVALLREQLSFLVLSPFRRQR